MTLGSCWAISGGRRYRLHNSRNKNRQYPATAGLSFWQTPPGAESGHDREGWETCGTGWSKRPPQGAGPVTMQDSKTYNKE